MAMLQLFIAPLLAALLTLWAAWLAFAAESDADLPRALGGEAPSDVGRGDAVPAAPRRPSLAARPGRRRRGRRSGLVGLVAGAEPRATRAGHRAGVGRGRPAARGSSPWSRPS